MHHVTMLPRYTRRAFCSFALGTCAALLLPCSCMASIAQGIGKPGLDLLRMASANVEDARSGCCGISGSYGFKKEQYDVAASVGSDLFKAVKDSSAEY